MKRYSTLQNKKRTLDALWAAFNAKPSVVVWLLPAVRRRLVTQQQEVTEAHAVGGTAERGSDGGDPSAKQRISAKLRPANVSQLRPTNQQWKRR